MQRVVLHLEEVSIALQPASPDSRAAAVERRRRRMVQECGLRATVAVLMLVFDHGLAAATGTQGNTLVRVTAMVGLLVNPVYYLAERTGWRLRLQGYVRMLGDIGLITLGLYGGGGLDAAPFVAVYALVPLYVGLSVSSVACLVGAGAATAAYLGIALAQQAGWLPLPAGLPPNAWVVALFNLGLVDVMGLLTALLAAAYRRNRLRLAATNHELEQAHAESLRLTAEIQRAAQFRALGEVVAGVAHEMANVLTVAVGHLGLLRRATESVTPETKRHLDRLETSLDAAMRIVAGTLQGVRRASQRSLVSMPDIARRVLELKAHELRRAGIEVRLDFPREFPAVLAVPVQLQQVLLNLVTNAQQAMRDAPPPRRLAVEGRVVGGDVVVDVTDSGPGIPPDVLPRLFEPFFTTKDEGTGLGLPISAGIARDHGGDLTAENGADGGAVFHLRLPAAPKNA